MKRVLAASLFALLAACGGDSKDGSIPISREPASVRGWVLDVKGAKRADNMEMEIARRTQLFQSTSLWIENSEYASGGISENGAFVILDVPPHNAVIGFNAPGAETAKLPMSNIPPTAEVMIPDVILEPNGATVFDPKKIVVRLPSSDVDKPTPTGKFATVAGHQVPIIATPLSQMMDRREYPNPGGYRALATVK